VTWDDVINEELGKPYFRELVRFLKEEDLTKTVLPPKEDRFSALRMTPPDDVRVVILGQDPYHNHGQAHGLAFSVRQGSVPPSLRNMYKELQDDLGVTRQSGDLSGWARQGVLLLNTVLTVRLHEPLSHRDRGWETFTERIVRIVAGRPGPCVFILWGAQAKRFARLVTNPSHLVLTAPHPSPLSASRGFFGSRPYSKTNAWLKTHGAKPIDWSL
jgi:uracil-DNA glycosylase